MKQIIFLMVTIMVAVSSFGQIENIKISSDSSIKVDKFYAGMLSSTAFNTKFFKPVYIFIQLFIEFFHKIAFLKA